MYTKLSIGPLLLGKPLLVTILMTVTTLHDIYSKTDEIYPTFALYFRQKLVKLFQKQLNLYITGHSRLQF